LTAIGGTLDDRGLLAVLGPTGYTGRLVVDEARRVGMPLRLVGRRREALDELAREGDEVRVADAGDEQSLREAFDGAAVVASLAGPFLAVGFAPVAAAVAIGAHYLDTTGEQAFARGVYEDWGPRAAERGVVLLSAFGFDYVPGDLAARLAADGVEPVDELVVAYSVAGMSTSRGTRRTVGHVMGQGQVAYADGRLVGSRFGATARRVRFPFGERDVVEWGGTEPLTVPRHTEVRTVRSYCRAPRAAAYAGLASKVIAPLVRLSSRLGPLGPSAEKRAKSRFVIVAEARGASGQRAVVAGSDPYGLTARLIVTGAELLRAGEARAAGALAPAEAFDARMLASRLEPFLHVEAVEPLV
jgi:short subunit dehydrogenase-like uncharacterized protein